MFTKLKEMFFNWVNRRPKIEFEYKIKKLDFGKMNYAERDNVFNLLKSAYYIGMESVHNLNDKELIYQQVMKARGLLDLYTELKATHDNELMAIDKLQREQYENDLKAKKKSIL